MSGQKAAPSIEPLSVNKEDRILSVIRLTKEYAALEQLKSAMFLWFHEADPGLDSHACGSSA